MARRLFLLLYLAVKKVAAIPATAVTAVLMPLTHSKVISSPCTGGQDYRAHSPEPGVADGGAAGVEILISNQMAEELAVEAGPGCGRAIVKMQVTTAAVTVAAAAITAAPAGEEARSGRRSWRLLAPLVRTRALGD